MPEAWEDREPVLPVCRSAAFGEAAVENRYRKELRNNYADPLLLFFFLRQFLISVIRSFLVEKTSDQFKGKRGMYAISTTMTHTGKPDKRPF